MTRATTATSGEGRAREAAALVLGLMRGDEARAAAVMAVLGGRSARAVAGERGFAERTLRYWVGKVRASGVRL